MAHRAALATEAGVDLPHLSTFHSLQFHEYRLLWLGQLGASASQWMEQLARPILILQLTDSPVMLGIVTAMRLIPQLFVGLWAGVLADRMDKRLILLTSQSVTLAMHLLTAILILAGVITPLLVMATTFVSGCSMAFNQPARSSLIPRLVPKEAMTNAIALNSAALNVMRVGGPSLAGLILVFVDVGELYLFQAALFVWVILWTARISVRTEATNRKANSSMLSELKEGFAVVGSDRAIFYMLLISLVIFVFGFPYQTVFVPLIALQTLGLDRSSTGLLISVVGIGALSGSLLIATFGARIRRRGLVMLGMIIVYAVALIGFAHSGNIALAIPCLIVSGGLQTAYISLNNTFVLMRTDPALHGRVMSLFSLDRGLIPLGALLGGVLADAIGPQGGLTIMALICLTLAAGMSIFLPAIRKID